MGSLISAPLSAAGTCLGGCFGSCVATGCCKLAASGSVSSAKAARFVLIWLQVFTTALAFLLSATAEQWLPWTCEKLDVVGMGSVGVCSCRADSNLQCWKEQMILRSEAAGTAVFLALMFMSISGCAEGAARSYSIAKFMAIVLLIFISLFLPNPVLSGFGTVATAASAVFLVAQAVLLIDFGYTWNELWYANAEEARRREVGPKGYRMWTSAIILASAALFLGSIIISVYLLTVFQDGGERAFNIVAMLMSFVLLLVSITGWCEHGALLTSCVVMAYTVWLMCEAFSVAPQQPLQLPSWAGLTLCSLSLLSTAAGAGGWGEAQASSSSSSGGPSSGAPRSERADSPLAAAAAESGQAGAAAEEAEAALTSSEAWRFAASCGIHASAAIYVASSLAPRSGHATFGLRVTAVFLSLGLYGWSLVAPKVLKGRRFN
mmetsp:Transcript_103050/g.183087  ORF Transcript_103050/g.183087 Transcript_103050/m.183087 type:complete len:434 (-) Transcript_103050:142-1443(-)|eukprot:CAMPEP_0197627762 /NCGR_PEP_ID=MMETSP1338-20131121/6287_1 /TAXON_ID=43686 ORGANISM="Pelagodinium beii, Strain RCC1491" /NCGR_SAMPLE_ID=MMETSP1338 /ASSEMBLY_ACC=CAM_ASM_000754 /LENGTH=433 /DNA_ID=CAMNT_0043198569 /DNA_START=26 /DNA_END=1327 /DNA_ORIENTATION=+